MDIKDIQALREILDKQEVPAPNVVFLLAEEAKRRGFDVPSPLPEEGPVLVGEVGGCKVYI